MATLRSCVTGWLLCVLVTLFALFPAQCTACNGVSLARQVVSAKHTIAPVHISSADTCDGACSCCLLQVLPLQFSAEIGRESVSGKLVIEPIQPELIRPSTLFRPPRFSIAS
jgi:hypothetical protein